MKIKYLLIVLSFVTLFACTNNSSSQENSSSINSIITLTEEEKFEQFKKAITFEENDTFTGYRLNLDISAKASNEKVYSLIRYVSIDNTNNCLEYTETVTQINDIDNLNSKTTTTKHYYYTAGSIIEELDDGRYQERDGTITKSSGMPKFNPTMDCYSELKLNQMGNVINMNGTIDPSKANTLFESDKLDDITNATMSASLYDYILEEVSWKYEQNDFIVNQKLVISYSNNIITVPSIN